MKNYIWLQFIVDTDNGAVYSFDPHDKKNKNSNNRPRPKIDKYRFVSSRKLISYKSSDGLEILHIWPCLRSNSKTIAIDCKIHNGGPWARDGWDYDVYAQF